MAINSITNAIRTAMCDPLVDALDAGAGAGKIKLYTVEGGTLLATLTFSDPAFGAATNGVATASAITDDAAADASGTATVVHFTDSDDNVLFKGTVGTSGADINFNSNVFVATVDVISISAMTVTMPAGA